MSRGTPAGAVSADSNDTTDTSAGTHAERRAGDVPGNASREGSQNFIRHAIDDDLASHRLDDRRWAGQPGLAAAQREGATDPARIRTRFPPEPNGYLHIGHAKSICLNFGLARDYSGRCHMRFDDTNPAREEQEFVDAILEAVRWLGFDWRHQDGETDLYFASDYFEDLYRIAVHLIEQGCAYVDSQSADQIRDGRGTLLEPGLDSPFRDRTAAQSLALFREMRAGQHADGSHVLRARIDMRSPNINMRDPVLYRIRRLHHHRTGDAWPIYPMYDYAHPLSDAIERITHSLCTLEFEDHRPLYDWLIARAAEGGFFDAPLPRQIEFARGRLTYTITSKRKLKALIDEGHVNGWDDPRMTTILGLRRRGFTPQAIRTFWERVGVSKSDSWIDFEVLEQTLREDLEGRAGRLSVIVDPVRMIIDNWPEGHREELSAPVHPHDASRGLRRFHLGREVWIDRDDFAAKPPKGFFRLTPGQKVRLRYGYVVECTGFEADADGRVSLIRASYLPDTRSGTPGADSIKVKGNVHWVGAEEAVSVELRLYERLFTDPQPDAGGRDYVELLNPDSKRTVTGWAEPFVAQIGSEEHWQFERTGYFVSDRFDHQPGHAVFNRTTSLKESYPKRAAGH